MRLSSHRHPGPQTPEEKVLVSRARDLAGRSAYSVAVSDFLTPREQILFAEALAAAHEPGCFFWGGAIGAERRCAVLLPDWLSADAPDVSIFDEAGERYVASLIESGADGGAIAEAIVPLSMTGSHYATLTHRDWLGSILALGIKREVIGDIAVYSDCDAVVFASAKIAPFLAESLTHVKNDVVKVRPDESGRILEMPRTFKHLETIVASMRLDCVVKSLTNLSRAEAADLVRAGHADLNYFTETDVDADVCPEDILTIHGYGKFILDRAEDHTKSGRIKLKARQYV